MHIGCICRLKADLQAAAQVAQAISENSLLIGSRQAVCMRLREAVLLLGSLGLASCLQSHEWRQAGENPCNCNCNCNCNSYSTIP